MSGFVVLLLAVAAAAWGTAALLHRKPPWWAAAPALLVFAGVGILAVLLAWISGDGVVLPGLQLSPGLRDWYLAEAERGQQPGLRGWLLWLFWLAPAAHLLAAVAARDRLVRLLPATALFVALFFALRGREAPWSIQAPGPDGVAYLTVVPDEEGARLLLAAGEPMATLLRVVHEHEAESRPPRELQLLWTRDGEGLVLRIGGEYKPSFAVALDGETVGALPRKAREWPGPADEFTPADVQRRLQEHRRRVAEFVQRHGDIFVP